MLHISLLKVISWDKPDSEVCLGQSPLATACWALLFGSLYSISVWGQRPP